MPACIAHAVALLLAFFARFAVSSVPLLLEQHTQIVSGPPIDISIPSLEEYQAVLVNHTTVFFFRVINYPTLYPHWQYLYYGHFSPRLLFGERLIRVSLTDNSRFLVSFSQHSTGEVRIRRFERVTLNEKVPTLSQRSPLRSFLGTQARNTHDLAAFAGFHLAGTADEHSDIWTGLSDDALSQLADARAVFRASGYLPSIKPRLSSWVTRYADDNRAVVSPDGRSAAVYSAEKHAVLLKDFISETVVALPPQQSSDGLDVVGLHFVTGSGLDGLLAVYHPTGHPPVHPALPSVAFWVRAGAGGGAHAWAATTMELPRSSAPPLWADGARPDAILASVIFGHSPSDADVDCLAAGVRNTSELVPILLEYRNANGTAGAVVVGALYAALPVASSTPSTAAAEWMQSISFSELRPQDAAPGIGLGDLLASFSQDNQQLALAPNDPAHAFVRLYIRCTTAASFAYAPAATISLDSPSGACTPTALAQYHFGSYATVVGCTDGRVRTFAYASSRTFAPSLASNSGGCMSPSGSVPLCDRRARYTSNGRPPASWPARSDVEHLGIGTLLLRSSYSPTESPTAAATRRAAWATAGLFAVASIALAALLRACWPLDMYLRAWLSAMSQGPIARLRLLLAWPHLVQLVTVALLVYSVYEAFTQAASAVEWSANLNHAHRWLSTVGLAEPVELGAPQGWDYTVGFMHYQGPCTHPAGFLLLYALLSLLTGGSLLLARLLWALTEFAHVRALAWFACESLGLDAAWPLLGMLSRRLHVGAVHAVASEFPLVALHHVALYLLVGAERPALATLVYSLVVACKFDFFYCLPALGLVVWAEYGFVRAAALLFLFAGVQAAVGAPFLWANARAYIAAAYNVGSTTLWEKSRAYMYVGRLHFEYPEFRRVLAIGAFVVLALLAVKLFVEARRLQQRRCALVLMRDATEDMDCRTELDGRLRELTQLRVRVLYGGLLLTNLAATAFSPGFDTLSICRYFYDLPVLLALVADSTRLPHLGIPCIWLAHEALFHCWGSYSSEMWASFAYSSLNMATLLLCIPGFLRMGLPCPSHTRSVSPPPSTPEAPTTESSNGEPEIRGGIPFSPRALPSSGTSDETAQDYGEDLGSLDGSAHDPLFCESTLLCPQK